MSHNPIGHKAMIGRNLNHILCFLYEQAKKVLVWLIGLFRPKPVITVEPVILPEPELPVVNVNRHTRRAWEKQRRKHDKFVEPKGPEPVKIPRKTRQASRKQVEPQEVDDSHDLIDGEDGKIYLDNEVYGEFAFRDTILDQLDRYWVYLRRMRKHDPDAYGFYRQIGAHVVPLMTWFLPTLLERDDDDIEPEKLMKLSPWWKDNRPTFGCVTFGISSYVEAKELAKRADNKNCWIPKFLYFTKYKNPPLTIQPISGGDVYCMTVWWDRPQDEKIAKKMKGGVPEDYAVFISSDAKDVHVIPTSTDSYTTIHEKRNGLKTFTIHKKKWAIADRYTDWAKLHGTDTNTFLTNLFINAARVVETTNYSVVRIAVQNNDLTAVFGVDIKRIPYFFQDRDITLTDSGVKQRIFHIVRPHIRSTGAAVRFHFRGLREFEWAGYRVRITVPGRDHFMLPEFNLGMIGDLSYVKKGEKLVTSPELATRLVGHMEKGLGGYRKQK